MISRRLRDADVHAVLVRFMAKIERDGDCWLWVGALNSKGYPVLRVGGGVFYAHRLSHELFLGAIPGREQVHHRCMNPRCVNPDHLMSVSADLNRQMQAAGVGSPDEIDGIPI